MIKRRALAKLAGAVLFAVSSAVITACGSPATAGGTSLTASTPTITFGSPECGQCLAMSLLPREVHGYNLKYTTFANASDAATAMASGHMDFVQITYTNFPSLVSKNLDVVATSGEVNGGSDLVVSPSLHVAPGDWTALKGIISKDKASGHRFTIGSFFGTIQDIELRLLLNQYGINPNSDVNIVNVPYPGMAQAMHSGSVQAVAAVQPFGREITSDGFGAHFSYMSKQPAGNLTNLVVFNGQFLRTHPKAVLAVDRGMVALVKYLKTPAGKQAWEQAIEKYTHLPSAVVLPIMKQFPPNITMSLAKIEQIANAMHADGLISSPLTASALKAHIDYKALSQATGKSVAAVGG